MSAGEQLTKLCSWVEQANVAVEAPLLRALRTMPLPRSSARHQRPLGGSELEALRSDGYRTLVRGCLSALLPCRLSWSCSCPRGSVHAAILLRHVSGPSISGAGAPLGGITADSLAEITLCTWSALGAGDPLPARRVEHQQDGPAGPR